MSVSTTSVSGSLNTSIIKLPSFNGAKDVACFYADMAFSFNHLYDDYESVQIGKSHVYVPITKSYRTASYLAKTVLVVSTVSLFVLFGVIPAAIPLLLTLALKMLASRSARSNNLEILDASVDSTEMSTAQKKEALIELFDWLKSHIFLGNPKHLDQWHPQLIAPDVTHKTDAEIDVLYQNYVANLAGVLCDGSDRTSSFLCGLTISKKSHALALATQDIIHRSWTTALDRDGHDVQWSRLPELWFHTKCFSKDSFNALKAAFKASPDKAQKLQKSMKLKIENSEVADKIFMSLLGYDIVTTRMRQRGDV